MLTYEQISEKFNIKVGALKKRRLLLQITPHRKRRIAYFNDEQISQMLECNPAEKIKSYKKLKIISHYEINKNVKIVAKMVEVNYQFALDTINEWHTGFITVESSMNDLQYVLEKEGSEYFLYDEDENLIASTEKINGYYDLNRKNIEAFISFRRKIRNRYKVDILPPQKRVIIINKLEP